MTIAAATSVCSDTGTVRTTKAFGAGCLLTVRQDAHARANASSTSAGRQKLNDIMRY